MTKGRQELLDIYWQCVILEAFESIRPENTPIFSGLIITKLHNDEIEEKKCIYSSFGFFCFLPHLFY